MHLSGPDHPPGLAWTSQFNMEFGGHNTFDDVDIDDAGLFAATAEHDFTLPPAQTNVSPQRTRPSGIIDPAAFTKGTGRGQEPPSRPRNPPCRLISPTNRRSLGAGISKAPLARPAAPESASRTRALQETLNRVCFIQTLKSEMATLRATFEAK